MGNLEIMIILLVFLNSSFPLNSTVACWYNLMLLIFLFLHINIVFCCWNALRTPEYNNFLGTEVRGNTCGLKSKPASCDAFFHGETWPMLLTDAPSSKGLVKLCQNDMNEGRTFGKTLFATLYSSNERIPVYTANIVSLSPNASHSPRPSNHYWDRVSLSLCSLSEIPTGPIHSMIGDVDACLERVDCGRFQATANDYKNNEMGLDRGHLSPNSINNEDEKKQLGTFTLTNAAPQYANFNRFSWREFECVTQQSILELAPNENVYVMTGTYGTALDDKGDAIWLNSDSVNGKNPVKVPGFYWKAVCYPGNKTFGATAWAYALIEENINVRKVASYKSYINIKEFSNKYFETDIFGVDCMEADFGSFGRLVFPYWSEYLKRHCFVSSKRNIKNEL